jgi:hypothetical protein
VKHRRIAILSVGAVAIASVALSACSSSSKSGTPSSPAASPSVAPAQVLTNSIAALKGQAFDIKLDLGGLAGTGSIDPSHSAGTVEAKGSQGGVSVDITFTEIGSDAWAKLDLGALTSQLGIDPHKWLHLDLSKLTGRTAKPFDLSGSGDALDLAGLVKSVANVKQVDATHLSGTIDLTAATGVSAPDSATLTKAGATAKSVPFTATLDDQGRLAEFKVTGSSDLSADFQITNFGSPTPVTAPPASDVVEAPDSIYQFFNG